MQWLLQPLHFLNKICRNRFGTNLCYLELPCDLITVDVLNELAQVQYIAHLDELCIFHWQQRVRYTNTLVQVLFVSIHLKIEHWQKLHYISYWLQIRRTSCIEKIFKTFTRDISHIFKRYILPSLQTYIIYLKDI